MLLILPGTLDDTQAEKRSQEVVDMVKEHGTHVELSSLGKNRLAYPIRQIRYGYFYTIVFEAETKEVQVLQHKLSLTRDLLRAVVTHFNTHLTTAGRAAYAGDNMGKVTQLIEESQPGEELSAVSTDQPAVKGKKEEKAVNMDDVKKKLDKILEETDIIPGV